MTEKDLNQLTIPNADEDPIFLDNSHVGKEFSVYFRDIKRRLCENIENLYHQRTKNICS
jgi:hypothetical protein